MTTVIQDIHPRLRGSLPFLEFLVEWEDALPTRRLSEVIDAAGGSNHVAVACVDLIKGFTQMGALSSPRVAAIVAPIVRLVQEAHAAGVKNFLLLQDAHPPDSPEFKSFPPHCTEGSEEAQTVDALAALPLARDFTVFPKTSIDSAHGTGLDAWVDAHRETHRIIVVGDCTDLCVFALAMHLRTRANAHRLSYEVVVPADCTATFDLSVDTARSLGAKPHDGDLLHRVFLYQMALNGIEVVRGLVRGEA